MIKRMFVEKDKDPYDGIVWEKRDVTVTSSSGDIVFRQTDVEVPDFYSQTAASIIANKYFSGKNGSSNREHSVRQIVDRVADTIAEWGVSDNYLTDKEPFLSELKYVLINQIAAFNSPVWFNVGVRNSNGKYYYDKQSGLVLESTPDIHKPQTAACFLLSVDDDMNSILEWYRTEGLIFKGGSGAGVNLSPIRSSKEYLTGGGRASGPLSFARVADVSATSIKSGGKTRRAAKMVVLNVDHPDIVDFIECKVAEERKARALIDNGWPSDFNIQGNAYDEVFFQSANHSVRVTDDFMRKAVERAPFNLVGRCGSVIETVNAGDLLDRIVDAAWKCGDPGLQFHDTIQLWNPCRDTETITTTNPCAEIHVPNNLSCNLASINLLKFLGSDGTFDVEKFQHVVRLMILAQEILVDNSGYPTPEIALRSHQFRPLGLGYSNLGALLMAMGLAYDSDEGREWAAAITSLMTATAYEMSSKIASMVGPFPLSWRNEKSFKDVLTRHSEASKPIVGVASYVWEAANKTWKSVLWSFDKWHVRNIQVTTVAPTGTISFMMDCDTTGIEPELALVKYKKLVGGGVIKIVNNVVKRSLAKLGYGPKQVEEIIGHIDATGTIEGAPHVKPEHLPVFDTSFRPANGTRFIHHMGHIRMVAAVQPFLSGAPSKTVNLPSTATPDDVRQCYIEAWRMGLKAISIYRDGSKESQPLNIKVKNDSQRRRLPETRDSITHRFEINGHDGYLTVGMYNDGSPGEIFITIAKEGSTLAGLADAFAVVSSIALQWRVPVEVIADKLIGSSFEPSGFTRNPDIPFAKSIVDYIGRWLKKRFVPGEDTQKEEQTYNLCRDCGSLMVQTGTCYQCSNCGSSSGCG